MNEHENSMTMARVVDAASKERTVAATQRYTSMVRSAFHNSTNTSGTVEAPTALAKFLRDQSTAMSADFVGLRMSKIKAALGRVYQEGVEEWLTASLQIGPLDNLYDRWICLNALHPSVILDPVIITKKFAQSVLDSGRWTPQKVQEVWPKNKEHFTRMTIISFLKGGYILQPVPRIPMSSTLSLRSGFDASKVRKAKTAVERWTHPEIYQDIQDLLRKPGTRAKIGPKPKADLAAVLYYFAHPVYRAPMSPFGETMTLYRGIHGDLATAFEKKGIVHERGFIAFSQSIRIAEVFARYQVILRLAVQDIQPGTPWVWFGGQHNAISSVPREQEVLLPPGSLRVGTTRPMAGNGQQRMLPVIYRAFYPYGNEVFDPSLEFIQPQAD